MTTNATAQTLSSPGVESGAAGQLLGYSLPLSPSGRASMLTPPPWHFSGEVTMVDFRVDPNAARRFLPPELDLGSDPGQAAAVFASWQWCSQSGAELADPTLNQFGEFLLLLACEFEGQPMARCPFAWVDEPVPMVRGWLQGMPKQLGVVHQTRPGTVGRAAPRLAPSSRFSGSLSVRGRRVAQASVVLEDVAPAPPSLHTVPLAHSLTFPQWGAGTPGRTELVASTVTDVQFSEIWRGIGELSLPDLSGPDLADLADLRPLQVGDGYVFSYAETLCGGRLLAGGCQKSR